MSLTLYEQEGCPFCRMVADRLEEYDLGYESVIVPERHSERTKVKHVSGQRQVPVLVDEEQHVVIAESDNILEYIDAKVEQPEAVN